MQIIVVGCGNIGTTIAKQLSSEGHNVTAIDTSERVVKDLTSGSDIMGIIGTGSSIKVLKDANVSTADLLIAVTDSDERNLLTCLMARKAGAGNTIARVRNPEYLSEIDFIKEDLGLSLSVNPELNSADEIARLLKFPSAIEIDTFANGRVEIFKFCVTKDNPLCNVALKDMHKTLPSEVLICMVERGNETIIPSGDFVICENDKISVVASGKKAAQFFRAVGVNQGKIKTCMIIGGGEMTFYLAEKLIAAGVEVKIIEKEKERCNELAELLPEAMVIYGDGADKGLLYEEGIERTQSFVALTNHDEENVMMSVFAKKVNPKTKLITKVHRSAYDDIIEDMNIGSIINPKLLTGERIVKYVRAMSESTSSNIEALYRMNGDKAEALEFRIKEQSDIIDVSLSELKLKSGVLIASIIHNGQIETPKGSSKIRLGDRVVVVTTRTGFESIRDILA